MSEQPARMMHWTCRKCGHEWDTEIKTEGPSRFPDAHQESICDQCVDAACLDAKGQAVEIVPRRIHSAKRLDKDCET